MEDMLAVLDALKKVIDANDIVKITLIDDTDIHINRFRVNRTKEFTLHTADSVEKVMLHVHDIFNDYKCLRRVIIKNVGSPISYDRRYR